MLKSNSVSIDTMEETTGSLMEARSSGKAVKRRFKIPRSGDKRVNQVLNAFLNSDERKLRVGNYFIDGPELYFRCVRDGELREDLIAVKVPSGDVIGNSASLRWIGSGTAFGRVYRNHGGETEIQSKLNALVPMIPFNVFKEAGLDLSKYQLVERGPEETVKRKRTVLKRDKYVDEIETVHFTGASLFRVDGSYFLFDLDRRELTHRVFNPFLVELPGPVSTISEAYDSLIPDAVREAQAAGLKVRRQGEFFFIPVQSDAEPDRNPDHDPSKTWSREFVQGNLQAGNNRPNYSQYFNQELGIVKGKVEHSGREHAALILRDWHRAVPNTATRSFTITGDVD